MLQLVNHPEHPVYNGDMGTIIGVDDRAKGDSPALWVQFDQQEVTYLRNQFDQVGLAYACSVHKAQGSEFPIVILPLLRAYGHMFKQNLLYTAVTRTKNYLILCGEEKALLEGITKGQIAVRNSCLKDLVEEEIELEC